MKKGLEKTWIETSRTLSLKKKKLLLALSWLKHGVDNVL